MAITTAQQTQILKITAGLFNAAPGATYLTDFAAFVTANGGTPAAMLALSNALAGSSVFTTSIMGGSVTTAAQVQKLMTNFGLVYAATPTAGTAAGDAQTWFTAQINAGRGFGQIIYDATTALSDAVWLALPANAIYASVATTLSNKAAVADYYSSSLTASGITGLATSSTSLTALQAVVSSVTSTTLVATAADLAAAIAAGGGTTGTTFTLTTGIDTFAGTSGNDTFQGLEANLGALDTINGGAGTDNFVLATTTAATAINGTQLSNVETLTISAATLGNTTTLTNVTGITTVANINSSVALTVVGVAAVGAVNITGVGNSTTITYADAAVTGTADTATLTLSGMTAGTVSLNAATAAANCIETIAVVSSGAANTLTLATNGTATTAMTISGAADLTMTMGTNLTTTAKVINASAATGDVSLVTLGAAVHTITGGTGADSFAFAANFVGAENATVASRDTVNGGAGRDTLSITSAIASTAAATSVAQTTVTNVEIIEISNASAANVDLTKFVGADTLSFGSTVGAMTYTFNTGSTAKFITGAAGDNARSFVVGGTGTTDVLNLTTVAATDFGSAAQTFTGVETLNISTGTGTAGTAVIFGGALTMAPSAGVTNGSIVATGVNALTLTGVVTAGSIDASALTGVLTVTAAAANGITILGGTKADVINGSAVADLITGNNGADTITGAAGNDTIVLTETTAAIDKVVFSGSTTAALTLAANGMDTITGFGATDTINIVALGDGAIASATLTGTLTAAAATSVFANDSIYIINTAATAGALTTNGTAVVTDFTNMTQVSAFLSERFSHTATTADIAGVIVWNVGTTSYVYDFDSLVTAGTTIEAAEIVLVGTITQGAALVQANIVIA